MRKSWIPADVAHPCPHADPPLFLYLWLLVSSEFWVSSWLLVSFLDPSLLSQFLLVSLLSLSSLSLSSGEIFGLFRVCVGLLIMTLRWTRWILCFCAGLFKVCGRFGTIVFDVMNLWCMFFYDFWAWMDLNQ